MTQSGLNKLNKYDKLISTEIAYLLALGIRYKAMP